MIPNAEHAIDDSTPTKKTRAKSGDGRKTAKGRSTPSLVPLDLARTSPIASFIDVIEARKTRSDLVLTEDNEQLLTELTHEYSKSDTLRRHGLHVRSKLLFCGPPGCGKTLTAEVLANETGLDLLSVKLDALISSFLGETASNLRTVMQAAEKRPCILFFDEFDALARARSDSDGHGELRRVVNSLLIMIERFRGPGFLIAATNLDNTIDDALWRRFDEVMLFDRPSEDNIGKMLLLKTRNFKADFDLVEQATAMNGFSYAEIDRVCKEAMKTAVLARRKAMKTEDYSQALAGEQRRRSIRERLASMPQ